MATVDPQAEVLSNVTEGNVVLEGVSWETYERLLERQGERRVFVTYDNGTMEIQTVSPSYKHENIDRFLEHLVAAICLFNDIPMRSGGSVTMRRADLRKGLEADGTFWIANEAALRGVEKLDLAKHPAPDLVIEVDVHASSVDRIESYRRLGVREVWWLRETQGLLFLVLNDAGDYDEWEHSLNLPTVERSALDQSLTMSPELSETERINAVLRRMGLR